MIKSLVNTKNVTAANCDEEPIHIPGSIQPHGFLVAVKPRSFTILYCSENCNSYFSLPIKDILGSNLNRFFSEEILANFTLHIGNSERALPRPFILTLNGVTFSAITHQSSGYVIIEFEPFVEELVQVPDIFIQAGRFKYHPERADNLKELCEDIARETRNITGYDRVMIYRFDELYNGEVFAENKRDDLKPFLGLHYPNTDIPEQARQLFMRNALRLLVDVNYKPVPIYTLQETELEPDNIDLSLTTLRSFSPIHLEYLINMGVVATLNIAIVYKGRLWGLISCHHYSPRNIPYHVRLATQLQTALLESQIAVREAADEFEFIKINNAKLNLLQGMLWEEGQDIFTETYLGLLQDLLNADGVILAYNDILHYVGKLPSESTIPDLLKWLSLNSIDGSYTTESLSTQYPAALAYSDQISGLSYHKLDKNKNCIVWTLKEQERFVSWGGNPEKAASVIDIRKALTPRKSFELWREQVKNKSRPWKVLEVDTARIICAEIQNHLRINFLKAQQKKGNDIDFKLLKATEELANMNWISTHDLKEPLRKIQLYASMILEKHGTEIPETVKLTVTRMKASAGKMQMLTEDLLNFSSINKEETNSINIDLNEVLNEVSNEVKNDLEHIAGKINIAKLPVVKGHYILLTKMFINLVRNSIKFAKSDVPLLINIDYKVIVLNKHDFPPSMTGPSYHCISISDNGIGFKPEYQKEIFRLFHRLNPRAYQGSGAGLAISKKIIELCGGYIDANGEENNGAVFNVYFPVQ